MIHRLNVLDGEEQAPVALLPGTGPRHIAVGPGNTLLVSGELASTVQLVLSSGDVKSESASGRTNLGRNYPSTIVHSAIHGSVWVANRGADTIRRFGIWGDDLVPLGETASGAACPEHLAVLGDRMIVAHSRSGEITVLPIADDGGLGEPIARATVPQAVWVEAVGIRSMHGIALVDSCA
jgi:6-phosphogluconolactonase (cycloisomerase 2 family)